MKTRIFSRKDGKTLIEHIQDAADWVKAMVNGLPAKVKKLLPTVIVTGKQIGRAHV